MDSIGCDMNHLDVDVRLPPRKRFLAGLKRQSCSESSSLCSQVNPSPSLTGSVENIPSPSLTISAENISSPSLCPSIGQCPLSEFDDRLKNLLKSHMNGSNMSPEEIASAAKAAADVATKAAKLARAVAEEKAAFAAKAVAAAKTALSVVASQRNSRRYRKNRLKKHVPVEILYNKYQSFEKIGEDEEVARKLHRAMNSSPRISKHFQGSESKNIKHKRLKIYSPSGESGVSNVISMRDVNVKFPYGNVGGRIDSKGSSKKEISYTVKGDERDNKVPKFCGNDEVEVGSDDGESIYPEEKSFEGFDGLCINVRTRKRGRIKQKKLPSMCSSKDQESPKEESTLTNSWLTRVSNDKSPGCHLSLTSANVTPVEVAPRWKCQDFKVSRCIKQDKLVQS